MTRDQALSKIKKCLALAKSSNPHEAANAMRQAQKLMAAHHVTELDASISDVSESATPAQHCVVTPWENALSHFIAKAFGCSHHTRLKHVRTAGNNVTRKREYVFVGMGATPQVASYAYNVLARQCARDRMAHIRSQSKNCKAITKTARGDEYALGWVYGVRGLVDTFAGNENDQDLIKKYVASRYPDMGTTKTIDRTKGRNIGISNRYLGMKAGENAQLNRAMGGMTEQAVLA